MTQQVWGAILTGDEIPVLEPEGIISVHGPVGLARISGWVYQQGGLWVWINLVAFFNFNLAIINLLPIPALDGGRLAFIAIEKIRRGKAISLQKELWAHRIGSALLVLALIFITLNDVYSHF